MRNPTTVRVGETAAHQRTFLAGAAVPVNTRSAQRTGVVPGLFPVHYSVQATCRQKCHDLQYIRKARCGAPPRTTSFFSRDLKIPRQSPARSSIPRYNSSPEVVMIWIITGILFQTPSVFAILSAVLWWSALLPKLNPFDALYNRTSGKRPSGLRVSPAPPPRGPHREWPEPFLSHARCLSISDSIFGLTWLRESSLQQ